jgi:hypothetical protein
MSGTCRGLRRDLKSTDMSKRTLSGKPTSREESDGIWTVRIDGAGQFTVEHERPRPKRDDSPP